MALGLVVALAGAGVLLLTGPEGPQVALALDFEEGRTYRERLSMSMAGTMVTGGEEVVLDMEMTEIVATRVLDVDEQGRMTLEMEIESFTGSVDGKPLPPEVADLPTTTVTVYPDGHILTQDGLVIPAPAQGPAPSMGMPMSMFPLLPDHPVGPGDTWEFDYRPPIPFGDGAISIETDNRFLRYERVDGLRAAVIESDTYAPIDLSIDLREMAELFGEPDPAIMGSMRYRGTVEGEQTVWLAPALGEMLRSDGTVAFDILMSFDVPSQSGAAQPMDGSFTGEMTMEMERL